MHKSLIALAAVAGIGLTSLAAPAPANAACFGCAVGAGIIGGVAAGAILGSAIANSPPPPPAYYPPPPPGYYPPPPAAYGPPGPGYAELTPLPGLSLSRPDRDVHVLLLDRPAWHSRPVRFCSSLICSV
jgi:hypothetical protein